MKEVTENLEARHRLQNPETRPKNKMEDFVPKEHREGDTPYYSLRESQETVESGDNPEDGDNRGRTLPAQLPTFQPEDLGRVPTEDDESDLGAMGPDPGPGPPDRRNREVDQLRHVLHQVMDTVGLLMTERQENRQARRERSQSRERGRRPSPARPMQPPVELGSENPPTRGWQPEREPVGPSGPPATRESGERKLSKQRG